jgi:ribonuclease R
LKSTRAKKETPPNSHRRKPLEKRKTQNYNYSKTFNGKLDLNRQGYGFVIVENKAHEDILVRQHNLGGANHNDLVEVSLFETTGDKKKAEGKILSIRKRNLEVLSGTIQLTKEFGFVIPDEKYKLKTDVFVPKENLLKATNGQSVIVKIVDWNEKGKNPVGKVIEILTGQSLKEVMWKTILLDAGFKLTFDDDVLKEAAAISTKIDDDEVKKRRDFRSIFTFTIDPHDAKDFDDAISYLPLPNGNFEVGIHIADVSHYVTQNSALDKHAAEYCTSVYMVDGTLPMLPEKLSNELCSLRPNEDKYTFSAVFELTSEGKIMNEWFGKTVIHSQKRFTYEEAQTVIESTQGPYVDTLHSLNSIAKKLREKKFSNGAINFDTIETKFKLDVDGTPIGIILKERKDSNLLIEDFMLLANKQVAGFIFNQVYKGAKIPYPYRIHDLPDIEKLKQFNQFVKQFGYKLNLTTPKRIASSFNELMALLKGKPEETMITSLGIRCMAKAVYSIKNIGHYGLGFENYSHFTSPIRRYPDVLSHRILFEVLNNNAISYSEESLEILCKVSSEREKKATEAERWSIKYKQAEYLKSQVGKIFEGVISGVTSFGIFVELIANKCEGMVLLRAMQEPYLFDEKAIAVIGKFTGTTYTLGDKIMVMVVKALPEKMEIELKIVDDK